jgi:negative regulator of flagellin synthesis FlgM
MSINNIISGGSKAPLENQKLSQQQQALNSDSAQRAEPQKNVTTNARLDSVSLTSSAQQLSQVQKKGEQAPIDQEKVDKLKKSIQSGEYQVNPETLALKISGLESEIFGTRAYK